MVLARLNSPATLCEAAVRHLREAIMTGELEPGAPLKDAGLATLLGLSATPVREALLRLATEGLVEIEPNHRKRVTPIDLRATVELMRVQNRIWAIGYEWGAAKLSPVDFVSLRTANAVYADAIARLHVADAIRAAHDFHLVLMQAAGNRELARVAADRLPLLHRFILLRTPGVVGAENIAHYETLLGCLEQQDRPGAMRIFQLLADQALNAAECLLQVAA